jgi:hypothetical protein
MLFLQIAEGVDDRTWVHHLRAGDYSSWFRRVIKDDELAREAAGVEIDRSPSRWRAVGASAMPCPVATPRQRAEIQLDGE